MSDVLFCKYEAKGWKMAITYEKEDGHELYGVGRFFQVEEQENHDQLRDIARLN
jgi:hypothetical protein